jgi:uncharacterized membrane protein
MLLIIAHHYVVNSEVWGLMNSDDMNLHSAFFYIFGAWGKTGINCFVLITGYFMCTSKITWQKFLKLYLEIKFYYFLILGIFIYFGLSSFSLNDMINILPFTIIGDSFTNAFMAFYLFIPFLNILVRNMTKKKHLRLVLLLLWVYTILEMAGLVTYNYLSWFITLFFIASYIRNYGLPYQDKACFWGWTTLIMLLLSIGSIFAVTLIGKRPSYYFVSDSNHLFALLLSVSSFMMFKNLKVRYNKWINMIAATTFGIFLIHTRGATMRHWLWYDFIDSGGHYNDEYYWAYAIGSVLAIFIVCFMIDMLRINLLEKRLFKVIDRYSKKQ